MIASSMITLGLSWWQAWICVWLGYGIVAPFIVANARPGAIFHITQVAPLYCYVVFLIDAFQFPRGR